VKLWKNFQELKLIAQLKEIPAREKIRFGAGIPSTVTYLHAYDNVLQTVCLCALVFVVIDSASVNSEGFNKMHQVNVVMTEHTEHLESSVKRGGAQQDVEKSYGKENCTYGDDDDHDEDDEEASGMDDKGRKCWTKPAIQRAIIIIIDALR
jgi:TATA-binding protein-associated factor Taf7